MRPTLSNHAALFLSISALSVAGAACAPASNTPIGTGGAVGSGGALGTGGAPLGTGGAPLGTGGAPLGTGGAPLGTGGAPLGTGGAPLGTGGAPLGTGGGGSGVNGEWGMVEDPGAGCVIPPMPADTSFTTEDPKLPDPFKKMDGTSITDKSEWMCRREEILQESLAYIYGPKPVPEEGSVSGTVTSGMISVTAMGTDGTASFTATVNMNGATAPAPAIIGYGGVGQMPVPSGIATINFSPVEKDGGSGAKIGPYFDAFGSDSPTGYLTAQAWQISRILDVLEQNPGTIDPQHIGVTGCSRYGKGAFVAGVLDNRIALTIPVESGIGGTVALRIVQLLDPGTGPNSGNDTEWPYHAISYVRWLSEIALGGEFAVPNPDDTAGNDHTEKLPIDMHEMMAMIAPRGLYIVDNPSGTYPGLDKASAYVTAKAGQMIFEALGVGDHFTYQGASGSHCDWRSNYTAPLNAMVSKFLKGDDTAATGTFATDLGNPPNHEDHISYTATTLTGEL